MEIKNKQLEILKSLDSFCNENNLTMMLGFGSLLGAIRHSGFIPWDDDIDVWMPRKDFNLLRKIPSISNEFIVTSSNNSLLHLPFIKISDANTRIEEDGNFEIKTLGVNIDVFPLDYFDNNKTLQYYRLLLHRYILNIKIIKINSHRNVFKNFVIMLLKIFFYFLKASNLAIRIDNIANKISSESKDFVGCLVWGYTKKTFVPSSEFAILERFKFETLLINIPKEYDLIFKKLYGNYQILPDLSKRISSHNFSAYQIGE